MKPSMSYQTARPGFHGEVVKLVNLMQITFDLMVQLSILCRPTIILITHYVLNEPSE